MTEQEKIEYIQLVIGDIPSSPFYPLFTQEEIKKFLTYAKGNVNKAIRQAAISAAMLISGVSTRELTGSIEVWNELSRNYIRALELLIKNSNAEIPENLMPWGHTIPLCNLTNIKTCSEKWEYERDMTSCLGSEDANRDSRNSPCSC